MRDIETPPVEWLTKLLLPWLIFSIFICKWERRAADRVRFLSSMASFLSLTASIAPLSTLPTIASFSPFPALHMPAISFSLRAALSPIRRRSEFLSISASGNGNGGLRGESGGDGDDGGPDGGGADSRSLAGESEQDSSPSGDVIVLDVRGMTCKGCSASVQRILETQPQVAHASVDLASETAVVWPVAEAKITPNWREELGPALAKHLTTCGFSSNVQGQGAIGRDVSL